MTVEICNNLMQLAFFFEIFIGIAIGILLCLVLGK